MGAAVAMYPGWASPGAAASQRAGRWTACSWPWRMAPQRAAPGATYARSP